MTGVFAFKAFKERHDTKFRELSIISILTLVAVVLIAISNFQSNQSNNDQFRASLHFIEVVSKNLDVDKSKVYVNTLLLQMALSSKLETSTIVPSQVQNLTATC